MSTSTWILIGSAFVVTIILLLQVVKFRRMISQPRNDDRFSGGARVLNVMDTPSANRSIKVVTYYRDNSETDSNPATRPIRTTRDLRYYTSLRTQCAVATSTRTNSAYLRVTLLALLLSVGILVSSFAVFSLLAW